MANQRRSFARHDRLRAEAAALAQLASRQPSTEDVVIGRASMLAALESLTSIEREALLLTAWDGLSDTDAAAVADCSARAFRVRLHRARRHFERVIDTQQSDRPLTELLEETT